MLANSTEPAKYWLPVTTSDTNRLAEVDGRLPRALYIGVSGDVVVKDAKLQSGTFKDVPIGILDVQPYIVMATGTTATNIIALY